MAADNISQAGRQLYHTRIDSAYDADRDFALGPWCFIGREDVFPGWEDLPFTDPFRGTHSLRRNADAVGDLVSFSIRRIGRELNARHSTDHELPFWWPLLVRWVANMTMASWTRWVRLGEFVRDNGDAPIVTRIHSDPSSAHWDFRGTQEFFYHGIRTEAFEFWLQSCCIEAQAPAHWSLRRAPPEIATAPRPPIPEPPVSTNRLKRFVRRRIGRLAVSDINGMGGWALPFSLYARLLRRRPGDAVFRAPAIETPPAIFPDDYLKILERLLAATMPATVTDRFGELQAAARTRRYAPGRLAVTGAATSNDANNFVMANAAEAGERIVRYQHGADYGTTACTTREWLAEYMDTAFLTWGWTAHDGHACRFVPVPSPALSRVADKHIAKTRTVLMVGTRILLHQSSVGGEAPPAYAPVYRQEKVRFISALSPEARADLLYRPYTRDPSDLEEVPYLERHLPGLAVHRGDFEPDMLACRLLVLDHLGTTLNIAMAANVPLVCYWHPDAYPVAAEAQPYFDALADAGILFADAAGAANHVNDIHGDVTGWWRSPPVAAARRAWADRFARSSWTWKWDWLRVLASL